MPQPNPALAANDFLLPCVLQTKQFSSFFSFFFSFSSLPLFLVFFFFYIDSIFDLQNCLLLRGSLGAVLVLLLHVYKSCMDGERKRLREEARRTCEFSQAKGIRQVWLASGLGDFYFLVISKAEREFLFFSYFCIVSWEGV